MAPDAFALNQLGFFHPQRQSRGDHKFEITKVMVLAPIFPDWCAGLPGLPGLPSPAAALAQAPDNSFTFLTRQPITDKTVWEFPRMATNYTLATVDITPGRTRLPDGKLKSHLILVLVMVDK
ncbi:hypothetical protein PoB_001603000 [Plakobranchus ocellatus]|uniref:Uncharacterized protein n=1 Tax=Plakobranchus ocellatus TaxID=259542 RepID=A0AAV3Z297_9GAST|nr:hypothetical protein PoB_001603000 [Plakobranchus ocellatus]